MFQCVSIQIHRTGPEYRAGLNLGLDTRDMLVPEGSWNSSLCLFVCLCLCACVCACVCVCAMCAGVYVCVRESWKFVGVTKGGFPPCRLDSSLFWVGLSVGSLACRPWLGQGPRTHALTLASRSRFICVCACVLFSLVMCACGLVMFSKFQGCICRHKYCSGVNGRVGPQHTRGSPHNVKQEFSS